jgi:hypothetical protein
MKNLVELRIKLFRRAVEFNTECGPRVILWHYSKGGGSARPLWQWDFKKRPVIQREQPPMFECVGVRIAPATINTRASRAEQWVRLVNEQTKALLREAEAMAPTSGDSILDADEIG